MYTTFNNKIEYQTDITNKKKKQKSEMTRKQEFFFKQRLFITNKTQDNQENKTNYIVVSH